MRGPSGEAVLQHTDTALVDESSWLLADRLGSAVGQTGGSRITGTARYSLFGEPTFDTVGWDAVPGFTGELVDEPTGLVAFHARGYDPASKTWLSADPWRGTVTAPGTQNRYGYVLGNPATYVDHLGNRPVIPDGGGGTARIGAAARARANAAEWAASAAADRRERAQMLNRVNATRQAEGRHPLQTLATQNGMLDGKPGVAHNPQRRTSGYTSATHPPCGYNFYASNVPCTLDDGKVHNAPSPAASMPAIIDCTRDVKVGMGAAQMAINEACGRALADANLASAPEWMRNWVYTTRDIHDAAGPVIVLASFAVGTGAGAGSAMRYSATGRTVATEPFRAPPFRSDTTHIFRKATGHLARDTIGNRATIQSAVRPANLRSIETLQNGSRLERYFWTRPDGKQVWAEVRNGEITNGGVNDNPR